MELTEGQKKLVTKVFAGCPEKQGEFNGFVEMMMSDEPKDIVRRAFVPRNTVENRAVVEDLARRNSFVGALSRGIVDSASAPLVSANGLTLPPASIGPGITVVNNSDQPLIVRSPSPFTIYRDDPVTPWSGAGVEDKYRPFTVGNCQRMLLRVTEDRGGTAPSVWNVSRECAEELVASFAGVPHYADGEPINMDHFEAGTFMIMGVGILPAYITEHNTDMADAFAYSMQAVGTGYFYGLDTATSSLDWRDRLAAMTDAQWSAVLKDHPGLTRDAVIAGVTAMMEGDFEDDVSEVVGVWAAMAAKTENPNRIRNLVNATLRARMEAKEVECERAALLIQIATLKDEALALRDELARRPVSAKPEATPKPNPFRDFGDDPRRVGGRWYPPMEGNAERGEKGRGPR